jgi:hypothetical protein
MSPKVCVIPVEVQRELAVNKELCSCDSDIWKPIASVNGTELPITLRRRQS